MRPEYIRLVWLQCTIAIFSVLFAFFTASPPAAKSIAYGCCVVMLGTLYLAWRHKQGARKPELSAEWYLRQAYRTAIERLLWVVIMMALGFKMLELAPLWMLAGFVVGQATWLLVPIWARFENTK